MKLYSIGQFAKRIGKTIQTLRNWDKDGTFKPHYVAESGHRYDSQKQLNHFLGIQKQKDELIRQVEKGRIEPRR